MKRAIFATTSILLLLAKAGIDPISTPAQEVSQDACDKAIRQSQAFLVDGRHLIVTNLEVLSVADIYTSYPYQRPLGLLIAMDGDATEDMMQSPELLTSAAKIVIEGCNQVSLIRIGEDRSSFFLDIGLIGNQVNIFDCYESGSSDSLPWGYQTCGV